MSDTGRRLAAISEWINNGNPDLDPTALDWLRIAKITEEAGEVVAAYIGWMGQNPRKGYTHNRADVSKELLDVALTALAAWEHLHGNTGGSMFALAGHTAFVHERAGLEPIGRNIA